MTFKKEKKKTCIQQDQQIKHMQLMIIYSRFLIMHRQNMWLKKGAYTNDVNHANEHTRNKNKKKETRSLLVYLHKFSTSKILFLFDPRCPYIAGDIGCLPIFDAQTVNHSEKLKISPNPFLL